jgi:hypothetical protein
MTTWRACLIALALGLEAAPGASAQAENPEPHVVAALRNLQEAKRHLEALRRSDKRDHAIEYMQDAIKAVDALQK